jgi:hypothetical protein
VKPCSRDYAVAKSRLLDPTRRYSHLADSDTVHIRIATASDPILADSRIIAAVHKLICASGSGDVIRIEEHGECYEVVGPRKSVDKCLRTLREHGTQLLKGGATRV